MEHVVFYPARDGSPAFRRLGSLEEAVRFVEHLRNAEGVADVSVHTLTELPLAFKTWYRVEVPAAAGPALVPSPASPAAPAPAAGHAGAQAPDAPPLTAGVAEATEPAAVDVPLVLEPVRPVPALALVVPADDLPLRAEQSDLDPPTGTPDGVEHAGTLAALPDVVEQAATLAALPAVVEHEGIPAALPDVVEQTATPAVTPAVIGLASDGQPFAPEPAAVESPFHLVPPSGPPFAMPLAGVPSLDVFPQDLPTSAGPGTELSAGQPGQHPLESAGQLFGQQVGQQPEEQPGEHSVEQAGQLFGEQSGQQPGDQDRQQPAEQGGQHPGDQDRQQPAEQAGQQPSEQDGQQGEQPATEQESAPALYAVVSHNGHKPDAPASLGFFA